MNHPIFLDLELNGLNVDRTFGHLGQLATSRGAAFAISSAARVHVVELSGDSRRVLH